MEPQVQIMICCHDPWTRCQDFHFISSLQCTNSSNTKSIDSFSFWPMHTAPISIYVWKSGFLSSNLLFFQISGVLNDTKSTFCSSSTSSLPSSQKASTKRIAVVLRGECKFAKKAENAAKDGYKGLIILDTETNTNVERISGVRSLLTDSIAVVFLLRNEANILQELLSKSPNRTATLSGIILAQSSHYGAVCCVV